MLSALALNLALTFSQAPSHAATMYVKLNVDCPVSWEIRYMAPVDAYTFSCRDNGITMYVPSSEVPRATRRQILKLSSRK